MLLMATSTGGRGGTTVLDIAKGRFPFMGGNVVATFSLPNFEDTFSDGGITDEVFEEGLQDQVKTFQEAIEK